jgi:hypothetical protein
LRKISRQVIINISESIARTYTISTIWWQRSECCSPNKAKMIKSILTTWDGILPLITTAFSWSIAIMVFLN